MLSVAFVVFSASAQGYSIGIKAGYGVALEHELLFKDVFNVSSELQNGFHLGVYSRIGQRFYLQPEVLYNYSTYHGRVAQSVDDVQIKRYVISTFDIPILAACNLVNTNFFKLRAMVGPKLSFNAGSTKAVSYMRTDGDSNFIESIRDVRIGLDLGFGVDVWRMSLDVRYNLMPDLYKRQYLDGNVLKSKPFNLFQISLGFRLFGKN